MAATVKAPVPAKVKAPVPATVKAPVPATVKAPVPATVKAPVPATVKAPVPATVKAPVPADVRKLWLWVLSAKNTLQQAYMAERDTNGLNDPVASPTSEGGWIQRNILAVC